ncbi:tyrosine-type recombinase/integrase [Dechloromonas agitata]|uniref:tyrosine-type recombinase/integrase n=1 Tax=Dechloromonas agitata TaxID=73030 RepID=UPI00237E6C60|nr:integrase arm-type DNA-binding domain-containing protein [Dechloromonas agitata]MDE1544127.1 tyrosine-type recombinase/integrase [Dechloromonas agitata]
MALHELSDKEVRNSKPLEREYLLADGGGLFLRVRPTGAKDWLLVYTFAGNRRKLGLGSLEAVPLATARSEAAKARESIKQQIDPQVQRKQRQAEQEAQRKILEAAQARQTVQDLFDRWAEVDLVRRKDGGKEIRRMFEKDVLPKLGSLAVEDVKKGNITSVTDPLLARGVNRMAKLIFSLMRQMFRFAVDRDLIEADPTASIRKVKIGGPDVERDRVLSEAEIGMLCQQVPRAGLMPTTEAAVWIALSTLCRIGELLNARWSDIDLDHHLWRIPDTKNGKPHNVYLSDFSVKQFRKVKEFNSEGTWIYPSRDHKKAVSSKTITKQLGDRQRASAPMKRRSKSVATLALPGGKWGPHDLRRTGATMMTRLGVLPEVAERCLNHVEENRMKRIYQRHTYETEMREAWRLLGDHLAHLTKDLLEDAVASPAQESRQSKRKTVASHPKRTRITRSQGQGPSRQDAPNEKILPAPDQGDYQVA